MFNTLKGPEKEKKGKEKKKTKQPGLCFIKTISEEEVTVRHTASACSSTVVPRHVLDPSGDWTLESFAQRILQVPDAGPRLLE